MVPTWTIAGLGTVAAGALCLRRWYRWQSKAQAVRIVRAIECGDTDELAMLWAERAHPGPVRDWFGNPPLILAAQKSAAAARLLLALGEPVDERGVGWMTALMHAAAAGDEDICRLLLAHGADCDARDAFGRPAAWWAECAGHNRVVDLLRSPASPEVP